MITHDTTDSPRMSPENSDVFSLEALRAREVATVQSRSPEPSASGVIDLDALRAAGPAPMMTSPARRLLGTTMAAGPPTPRWAAGTLAVLGGAVAALGAVVALGLPMGTPATQDAQPAPTMAAAVLQVSDPAPFFDPSLEIDSAVIPDAAALPPTPTTAVVTPEPEPPTAAKPKVTRKRSPKATSSPAPAPSNPKAPARPVGKPKAPAAGEPSVSCILDPASCGLGSAPQAKPAPKAPATSLPDKLSSSQIRVALTAPKAKAKQCAQMHAADAGTKVSVKLSIAGSGSVLTATPQSPPSAALGRCVADALATAQFPAFSKPAMGVVYSVRL